MNFFLMLHCFAGKPVYHYTYLFIHKTVYHIAHSLLFEPYFFLIFLNDKTSQRVELYWPQTSRLSSPVWVHTEEHGGLFGTPTRHSSLLDLVVEQTSMRRVFCLKAVGESCMANTSLSSSVSWACELCVRNRQRVASVQGSTTTRTYLRTGTR